MANNTKLDNPFLVDRTLSGNRPRAEFMDEELSKAAESARKKIRSSFGLSDDGSEDKFRASLKPRRRARQAKAD